MRAIVFFFFLGSALSLAGPVAAGVINPAFDSFGSLPEATFGGSGIPNDAVAIDTVSVDGAGTLTMGLTAHERFLEPPVTNDGAGTFTALPGGFPGAPDLARWNFGFYIDVEDGSLSDYRFELLYDIDPGIGTDDSELGELRLDSLPGTRFQGSQNLGFGFLQDGSFSFITSPTAMGFDPTATGEYTFSLRAYDASSTPISGRLLGEVAIRVNTVPEPGTLAIFALGLTLGGTTVFRRRRPTLTSC